MSIISSFGSSYQATAPGPTPAQTGGGAEQLVATTGPGGFPLINGVPNIISWTAPNDGQLHRVIVKAWVQVSSAETGGQLNIQGAGMVAQLLINPNLGVGGTPNGRAFVVPPGQVVTLAQGTALTAGAAVAYGEIWAS